MVTFSNIFNLKQLIFDVNIQTELKLPCEHSSFNLPHLGKIEATLLAG